MTGSGGDGLREALERNRVTVVNVLSDGICQGHVRNHELTPNSYDAEL